MKKVMKLLTAGLVASFALATAPALATEGGEGSFMDKTVTWFTTDTYVGIQFGSLSHDTNEADINNLTSATYINSVSIDDGGTGYRLFFGKKFHKNFGVELGYADLGEIDVNVDANALFPDSFLQDLANATPVAPSGILIDAVGSWTFAEFGMEGEWADKLSLVGRLGFFMWETEVDYGRNGMTFAADDDGSDIHFGIGASYQINEDFAVRFEYEMFQSTTEVDMIGVGVSYSF
ncbi:MAG: outer membrane beta-barrel protein [Gammaproteobacteria bacterium]|nr:outer membrane beta-barrel protein [Gammaproteobacteria bacterium]